MQTDSDQDYYKQLSTFYDRLAYLEQKAMYFLKRIAYFKEHSNLELTEKYETKLAGNLPQQQKLLAKIKVIEDYNKSFEALKE